MLLLKFPWACQSPGDLVNMQSLEMSKALGNDCSVGPCEIYSESQETKRTLIFYWDLAVNLFQNESSLRYHFILMSIPKTGTYLYIFNSLTLIFTLDFIYKTRTGNMFQNLYVGCNFWHLDKSVKLEIIWAYGGKHKEIGWEGLWTYMYAPYIRKKQSVFIDQKIANLCWERDGSLSYMQWSMKCNLREKKQTL